MSLPAVAGNTIYASDIFPLAQPSGGQDLAPYYLDSWSNAATDEMGTWAASRSRGSTPVSSSIDTSIDAATNCNAPAKNQLNSYGAHVYTSALGANVKMYVGGILTINY